MVEKMSTSDYTVELLIAEDSPTQAGQIRLLLESCNYKVVITQNGKLAWEWLSENKPSLVISDITMPEMDGFELCRKIKSDISTKMIPVILLTSLSDPNEIIEGLSRGADGLIPKPSKKEYLISSIEKILSEKFNPKHNAESLGLEIVYDGKRRMTKTLPQKVVEILLNKYQEAIHNNHELVKSQDELRLLNERLEEFVDQRTEELSIANKKLALQNDEKEKRAAELIIANKKLVFQNREKEKRADELMLANKELAFQNVEKGKRAEELMLANKELAFQNVEKGKRAEELVVANKELAFQNREKEKRAAELIIANKKLAFQNREKEKRADELILANKELAFQNREKERRADELILANKELAFQNGEKEKRAEELVIANKELAFQNEEKEKRAEELAIANKELAFQNGEKEKRAGELVVANKELAFQNEEKEKRAAELIEANLELIKNEEKILAFNAELEKRVSEGTARADSANVAKSEFLANMSHEIRTPMNGVLGYADLLGLMVKDKTQKEYIESIKSSGRILLTLINGILDLSKIEAGRLELQFEYVSSESYFSEFERIFSLRLSEKGLKYSLDISSDTPEGIYIDDARLRQIILNLIGNAIKFTESGSIKLNVFTENTQVTNSSNTEADGSIDLMIEVIDTGIGIPLEMQDEVFKPFIQGPGQDEKRYGGTGLGLTITKRLLQLMNGTIDINSECDKGSTFKIKIPEVPFLKSFDKGVAEIELDPTEIIFEEAVILVADDVAYNRSYLRHALNNSGLKVIEAENGEEALALAKKVIPDLIISDIGMPVLDGFQLLNKIKSNKALRHIPVIAYTASIMKDQKDRIQINKFAGLLVKPVLVNRLYSELMRHLKYQSTGSPKPEEPVQGTNFTEEISDITGLIHSLDNKFKTIWLSFEINQPISEVIDFGNQLIELGENHNSSTIIVYGEELVRAADNFNIGAILKLIKKFTGIIELYKESPNYLSNG
jgi:signal transduction histidine kinase/PleD family two-component response regulator